MFAVKRKLFCFSNIYIFIFVQHINDYHCEINCTFRNRKETERGSKYRTYPYDFTKLSFFVESSSLSTKYSPSLFDIIMVGVLMYSVFTKRIPVNNTKCTQTVICIIQ